MPGFSLAFILVGLPILFTIREYIPISKGVFTNFIILIDMLLLVNYKNLFNMKFYFNTPFWIRYSIFTILIFFMLVSLLIKGFDSQAISLIVIFCIFLSLHTIHGEELKSFKKSILWISSVSIYLAFFLTPLDSSYWLHHGNRFYVGDTENPNLIASVAVINFMSILLYLNSKKKNIKWLIILIPLLGISPYLYFMSQGKSTIMGLIAIILYILYITPTYQIFQVLLQNKIKIFILVSLLVSIWIYLIDYFKTFFELIFNTIYSLFGLNNSSTNSVMSANIRKENFEKTWEYLSFNNFFGHGINTFRMDSPFLQTAVDFGNILAILFIAVALIYPLMLLTKIKYMELDENIQLVILLYLFYLPNLFFHGTPYEFDIWLPILLLYKFTGLKIYKYNGEVR